MLKETYLIVKDNIYDSLYDLIINIDNDRFFDLKNITRKLLISVYIKIIEDVYENGMKSEFYGHYTISKSKEKFIQNIFKPGFSLDEDPLQQSVEEYYSHLSDLDILKNSKSFFDNVYEETFSDLQIFMLPSLEQYIAETKWQHGLFCLSSNGKVQKIY